MKYLILVRKVPKGFPFYSPRRGSVNKDWLLGEYYYWPRLSQSERDVNWADDIWVTSEKEANQN